MKEAAYKDEGLYLDGVYVFLTRSKRDNRLLIEIDTSELETEDDLYDGEIPKLRLSVNDWVQETDSDGQWKPVRQNPGPEPSY